MRLNIFQNILFNPIHSTGLFLYPLKTSEKLWFFDVFRGYRKWTAAPNGLIYVWQGLHYVSVMENIWSVLVMTCSINLFLYGVSSNKRHSLKSAPF